MKKAGLKLYVITGASGKLGHSFFEKLRTSDQNIFLLTSRTISCDLYQNDSRVFCANCDLLDETETLLDCLVKLTEQHQISEVVFIHPVGSFLFEEDQSSIKDEDEDGIDDAVYHSNVTTFLNAIITIKNKFADKKITAILFGSVSDDFSVPYWSSYTRSKNILRSVSKDMVERNELTSCLFVNVTTVDTGNENKLRPQADKTYWLSTDEVASKTMTELNSFIGWKEIDIVKHNPTFQDDYYKNTEEILKKWRKEMGRDK